MIWIVIAQAVVILVLLILNAEKKATINGIDRGVVSEEAQDIIKKLRRTGGRICGISVYGTESLSPTTVSRYMDEAADMIEQYEREKSLAQKRWEENQAAKEKVETEGGVQVMEDA